MEPIIYFDHSATTRVCPEAAAAVQKTLTEDFGNPSSRHLVGRAAADLLRSSRAAVLSALGVRDGAFVFTSGGTEANALAILGRAEAKPRFAGGKILTTAGEHASVEQPLALLESRGCEVVRIPVKGGQLDMQALEAACDSRVFLATFMTTNNETGACYDIPAAAALVRRLCRDAVIHTDATQAFLKIPCSPLTMGVDMMTVSGHKIGAMKGVGGLWLSPAAVRARALSARTPGGGQEDGLRSGTENMPGIASFAAAAAAGKAHFAENAAKTAAVRAYLCDRIQSDPSFADVLLHLPAVPAPHILSLAVRGLPGETLLNYLSANGICVSAGSACSSNAKHAHASFALLAFGLSEKEAGSTVRLSFAPSNTKEEADRFLRVLAGGLKTLYRKG